MIEVAERTVQNGICKRLAELGWALTLDDERLGRPVDEVVRFGEQEDAEAIDVAGALLARRAAEAKTVTAQEAMHQRLRAAGYA
jgi:hypothetical protein